MEMFLPAVLSDLLGRSVSFLVQRYWQQSSVEESIEQLHLALLRVSVTVEEAERRRITNQAMLRQLDMLREAMYGGHYMLDALAYGQSHVVADEPSPSPSPCRFASALSRLNPAKRLCFAADNAAEARRVVDRLGCMLAGMKEFVVFLKGYPRVCRQPHSAHLLLEKLMFGRQREMDQIISFLLRGAESNGDGVGVLPVVGPARVGKSTLVEHVCHDDRVRNHFSSILLMGGDDLKDEKLSDPGDHGLIKHRSGASHKGSLVILELAEDEVPDEARWRRLRSSAFCKGVGSKIIVTSRSDSEAVQRLGTEHPLRLRVLRPEAYWYYFKTLAFGSTNPEEHPRLVAIAMDICREEKGSFIGANIACSLLRANLDARFWRSILDNMREYTEKHRHLFGKHPHDLLRKNRHVYLWRLARTSKVFVSYGCYQACPAAQEDVPRMITLQEVLSGRPAPCGRFEALAWRSQIPPCYSYLMSCSVQTPVPHVLARKKSSRLV